jgi:[acyl-carrier-protein] S-malonyltransferase
MGKDLFEQSEKAKEIYRTADEILGFPLSKISFEGPEELLKQTKNTQPAIFLHSIVVLNLLNPKLTADMAGGHSLGEYTALVYAGALNFEDALRLVRLRGELMQQAGVEQKGTMAAVIGLSVSTVNEICKNVGETNGIVQPANFNSPDQIVISGSTSGVKKAMELLKAAGAKLVKELPVSGAFHSPLMESAKESLRKALEKVSFSDTLIPVYTNVTAKAVTKGSEFRSLLYQQLMNPVRWEETILNMSANGASEFIEIGPGKVLQGLVKRINSTATTRGFEKWADVK